jgi:hypothetical protein
MEEKDYLCVKGDGINLFDGINQKFISRAFLCIQNNIVPVRKKYNISSHFLFGDRNV